MSRPLYDAIVEFNKKEKCSLHMPSHNGLGDGSALFASAQFDKTELEGLDNLLASDGVICQSEKLFARDYKCQESLLLTEGSTVGNQIIVNVLREFCKEIILIGDNHKSVWNACALWRVDCKYCATVEQFEQSVLQQRDDNQHIKTENERCETKKLSENATENYTKKNLKNCHIDTNNVIENATNNANCGNEKCVFVTSPDYFGNCIDIASLSQFCKKNGFLLAVDSAHGAHFPYSDLLPDSPCQFADISVCSLHKTMASYGGGAVLNVTNSRLVPYAQYYRQVIHSTSPNYLVMASADYCRDLWEKNGEKYYREIKKERDNFVANLPSKFFVEKSDDLSRLVVASENMDGRKAQEELGKFGVFVEMASGNKLVSILTPFNADKLELFSQALAKIEICPIDTRESEFALSQLARAKKIGDKLRFVTIDQAVGKVSANEVGIYPPGVPLAHRGDIFDQKTIKIIKDFQSCIFGLVKGFVIVLE